MNRKMILLMTTAMESCLVLGCESHDGRLARIATEAAERQAKQSERMAEAHSSLTHGARQLTESAGRSQEGLVALQQALQAQQAEIGQQRDQLEAERRALAAERRASPLIAAAILDVGMLALCALPLILSWHLLRRPSAGEGDLVFAEALIEEITAEQPRFLPVGTSAPRARLPPTS